MISRGDKLSGGGSKSHGDFVLKFHENCNITVSKGGKMYWESRSGNEKRSEPTGDFKSETRRADKLTMQDNGDFVATEIVEAYSTKAIHPTKDKKIVSIFDVWSTNTSNHAGAYAYLESFGVLRIYDKNDVPIWATDILPPGPAIEKGEDKNRLLMSRNGDYELCLQTDGNLVIYRISPRYPVWASGTYNKGVKSLKLADKGYFSLNADREILWWTNQAFQSSQDTYIKLEGNGCLTQFEYSASSSPSLTSPTARRIWCSLGENWMSRVPGDTKMCDMFIPGSHDCCVRNNSQGKECQKWDLITQLMMGVRLLHFKVYRTIDSNSLVLGDSYIASSKVEKDPVLLDEVLWTCEEFLKSRLFQTETLFIMVEEFRPNHLHQSAAEPLLQVLETRAKQGQYTSFPTTLSEARGKIVLLRRFSHASCTNLTSFKPHCGMGFDDFWQDNRVFSSQARESSVRYNVQDVYNPAMYNTTTATDHAHAVATKVALVDAYMQKQPSSGYTEYYFNFGYASDTSISAAVNEHILANRIENPSFVILDFMTPDLARDVYLRNSFQYEAYVK